MDATGTLPTSTSNMSAPRAGQGSGAVNVGLAERWASLIGGGLLALYGLSRRSPGGIALALIGAGLAYRGASGHCSVYQALGLDTAGAGERAPLLFSQPQPVEKSVTIERSPEELYRFWHTFENLPCFMKHLESVRTISPARSHWVAKAPLGAAVEWDAEITEDRENESIAWRSLENADVYHAGSVDFQRAPRGRGTIVKVRFEYAPPGGVLGATVAKLFGEEPSQQVAGDLRRFKQMMEAGEIATVEGQPSGREKQRDRAAVRDQAVEPAAPAGKSVVREASEESFPASDPPAWTMGIEDRTRELGA